MEPAPKLHPKSADRASWSLIPLWSQHWTGDKDKGHGGDYRSLAEIPRFGFRARFTLETEIVI